jgi:undecaprenyl-diphosphatase
MNLDLILLSIFEGLTEFIPVSSTAHLIILSKYLSIDTTDPFIKFYILFIQAGALLAVIAVFSKKVLTSSKNFINVSISFVPTAILGFVLYKAFKHLLEGNMILIATSLFVGGFIFIYLDRVWLKRKGVIPAREDVTKKDALILGIAQAVAIVPGVSRSGATIIAGVFSGLSKKVVFEYTFILALPTLGAAVIYDMYKSRELLLGLDSYTEIFVGFGISFVVAVLVLIMFKKMFENISLSMFGWYRILVAVIILISIFT